MTINKWLRMVRRENSKQQESTPFHNKVHFFVGQAFGSRVEVKKLIRLHVIETRRYLAVVKNDLTRVRAVCKGNIPSFNSDVGNTSGGKHVDIGSTSCPRYYTNPLARTMNHGL